MILIARNKKSAIVETGVDEVTIEQQKHGETIVDDELRSGRKSLCLETRHVFMCVADGRFFVGTPNGRRAFEK